MARVHVLTCLLLTALVSACSTPNDPFGAQQFSYRHDEANDRLLIFQHYLRIGGDFDDDYKARIDGLANGDLTFTYARDTDEWLESSSPLWPDAIAALVTELRARPPEELLEHHAQLIDFLQQLQAALQINEAHFYADEDGQVGAWQTIVIDDLTSVVKAANRVITEWFNAPGSPVLSEEERRRNRRLTRKTPPVSTDGNEITLQLPFSLERLAMLDDGEADGLVWAFFAALWRSNESSWPPNVGWLFYDEPFLGIRLGSPGAPTVTLESDDQSGDNRPGSPDIVEYVGINHGFQGVLFGTQERQKRYESARDAFLATGDEPEWLTVTEVQRSLELANALTGMALRYQALAQNCYGSSARGDHCSKPEDRLELYGYAGRAARAALALNDNLLTAHRVLAFTRFHSEWDLAGAIASWQREIELVESDSYAQRWLARLIAIRGDADQAIAMLDALTTAEHYDRVQSLRELSAVLAWRRRTAESQAAADAMLAASAADESARPRWQQEHNRLTGRVLLLDGKAAAAIDKLECPEVMKPISQLVDCAIAYRQLGDQTAAWRSLERLIALQGERLVAADVAVVLSQWGDVGGAFVWLERAWEQHDPELWHLKVEPWFEPLHDDPRYEEMLSRLGLSRIAAH
ncbi:MAG: hypothetical protein QNJ73_16520 [Gammaproteobacteria bacterium]|nr:hypothetical protein [Gammaproteobacteria bacterium]